MQFAPLIVSAVGAATSYMANKEQADDRRSILNRQLEETERTTDKSIDMVQQEGKRFDQQARMDALKQAEDKTYDQTQADIAGAGGAAIPAAVDAGNVSEDFLKTKAQRAIDEGSRLTSIARETAKARAPGMLNLDDSLSMARMQGDTRNLWGTNRNIARANSMDAEAVEAPGYGALGSIASAIGGGMAKGGFGQQSTSGVPPNPYAKQAGINFGGFRG
jgi:hypothetical protein